VDLLVFLSALASQLGLASAHLSDRAWLFEMRAAEGSRGNFLF
jgi:hypothetical protein